MGSLFSSPVPEQPAMTPNAQAIYNSCQQQPGFDKFFNSCQQQFKNYSIQGDIAGITTAQNGQCPSGTKQTGNKNTAVMCVPNAFADNKNAPQPYQQAVTDIVACISKSMQKSPAASTYTPEPYYSENSRLAQAKSLSM